jgi:hypothetical protein
MASVLSSDKIVDNFLNTIRSNERRIAVLERRMLTRDAADGRYVLVTQDAQIVDGWYQENASANQSAVVINRFGSALTFLQVFKPVRTGSITGIGVYSNTARVNGSLSVEPYISGVATGILATLDSTNTTNHETIERPNVHQFLASDIITIRITTSVTWSPTTADIIATMEIKT